MQIQSTANDSIRSGPHMKKSLSLEYKRPSNTREISNIWDSKNARTLLNDQKHIKSLSKSAKHHSTRTASPSLSCNKHVAESLASTKRDFIGLKENKKALKEVVHRKEQLQSILNHLKGPSVIDAASKSSSRLKSTTVKKLKPKKGKKPQKNMKILPPFLPTAGEINCSPLESNPTGSPQPSTLHQNPPPLLEKPLKVEY